MKNIDLVKKHLFTLISICSFFLCFVQCKSSPEDTFKSKGGLRLWVELDETPLKTTDEVESVRSLTMDVLFRRIEYYGIVPNIEWLDDKNCILLEIPEVQNPERVLNLLQSNANLEFWETYNLTDIYSQIADADKRLAELIASEKKGDADKQHPISSSNGQTKKDDVDALLETIEAEADAEIMLRQEFEALHPLFTKIQFNVYQTSEGPALASNPVIGYMQRDVVSQVMEYLNMPEIKSVLPFDIVFKPGTKPFDESGDWYELFALKKTTREGVILDGSVITEAKADSDNQGVNVIYLQMNDEGARQWARLTKDNIGRFIAIVVDDKVYSAPLVNDEITGGRSMISGQFTKEEALDLANMLNAGRMPVQIRIIKHEMVAPNIK